MQLKFSILANNGEKKSQLQKSQIYYKWSIKKMKLSARSHFGADCDGADSLWFGLGKLMLVSEIFL